MNRSIIALFALISVALAYPVEEQKLVRIVDQQITDPDAEGNYIHSYETENGIVAYERGTGDHDQEHKTVSGSYSYASPDGTPIHLEYTANEFGFQPTGDHLPVPPPIPEQIQRALEYIASHPHPEEDEHSS